MKQTSMTRTRLRTVDLAYAALFAVLLMVCAWINIPLTVPFTLQTFGVFAALGTLGGRRGILAILAYLLLGLVGLPIFTMGGGLGYVFQPSFGFLLGLIPSAWVMGKLTEGEAKLPRVVLACLVGLGVLYLVGLPYMYLILNVYLGKGLSAWTVAQIGMLVYLPGDALKIAATAAVYRPLRKALGPTAGTAAATN